MAYHHVVKGITHWHEHKIHDAISPLLGYNTWTIGTAQMCMTETNSAQYTLDLSLIFPTRADYLKCRRAIAKVIKLEPEQPSV